MTTTVDLPDGSKVYLNSESSLIYPSSFSGEKRNVQLKGEAFFEVQKDREHRFIVSGPCQTQIEVLGTSFNVEAFERDSFISTTLVEGKVRFAYQKNQKLATVEMKPGQNCCMIQPLLRLSCSGQAVKQRLPGKTERLFSWQLRYRKHCGCWRNVLM